MSAATAAANVASAARAGGEALERYRDDGPIARALGKLGRALPVPPVLLVGAGLAGLIALAATQGDGASDALVAAGVGVGRAARRAVEWPAAHRPLRVGRPGLPARLRVRRRCSGSRSNAGDSSHAAAFALIAALVFHHYDLVYRPRFQGVAPPDVVEPRGRRLGRPARARLGAAGRRRSARGHVHPRGLLGVAFAVECALSWARLSVEPLSVYEDEEDEGQ